MYKLDFSNGEVGIKRYTLCFEAIVAQKDPPAVEKWDTVIDLMRKFKKIGNPQENKVGGKLVLYDLDIDGLGIILLEKAEYKQLVAYVKAPVWPNYALEDVKDLVDWIESIKAEPGSNAPDARPEEKRRAIALEKDGNA